MFLHNTALISAMQSIHEQLSEYEEDKRFYESIRKMSPENASKIIEDRKKFKTEERRHRELCRAIRDSGTNITIKNSHY